MCSYFLAVLHITGSFTSADLVEQEQLSDAKPCELSKVIHSELSSFSRGQSAVLLEALVRYDDAPWLLDEVNLRREFPLSISDLTCVARALRHTLAWQTFRFVSVLVTGHPRSESLLLWQLPRLCIMADLLIIVSWTLAFDQNHWIRTWNAGNRAGGCQFQFIEIDSAHASAVRDKTISSESISQFKSRLNSEEPQDIEFRVGLRAIKDHFYTRCGNECSSVDVLVIKTRLDAYLPVSLFNHIVELNYSVPVQYFAGPFLYRIWIPWVDAIQPFYYSDDTFAGALLDMWQLCWAKNAMYAPASTIGIADTHVLRWLAPFVRWYSRLEEFRQNVYDVSNRLLHTRAGSGASIIVELAGLGSLPSQVDAYLVELFALHYKILVTFFHVGYGVEDTGGVHLILRANASVAEVYGKVHLNMSEIRCRPGNWGFNPANFEVLLGDKNSIKDDWAEDCKGTPADISAGLVRLNNVSMHWAKPVSSIRWVERMVAGLDVAQDGLTERVVAAMDQNRMEPHHFTDTAYGVGSNAIGEELQTGWCQDFAEELDYRFVNERHTDNEYSGVIKSYRSWNPADKDTLDWWGCCNTGNLPSPCFAYVHMMPPQWHLSMDGAWEEVTPEALTGRCCFPTEPYCPRWLSLAGFRGLLLAGLTQGHPLAVKLIEMDFIMPKISVGIAMFCGTTTAMQKRKAQMICRHERATWDAKAMCLLRNLSYDIMPRLAAKRGPRQHFFAARTGQQFVRVRADYMEFLA